APRERRGELIGVAMGAAVGGALLGPVVGAVASVVGTGPAFSAVAVLGGALAVWAWRTPAYPPGPRQPVRALVEALHEPRVLGGRPRHGLRLHARQLRLGARSRPRVRLRRGDRRRHERQGGVRPPGRALRSDARHDRAPPGRPPRAGVDPLRVGPLIDGTP